MPVKFKPDHISIERGTGKKSIQRFYIRNTPKEELFEAINKSNTTAKLKQKCINELVRRGISIDWVDKD
jgi:hypothetical protein